MFELIITVLAVGELLLFAGVSLPHFELKNLQQNAFPHGWQGVFAAIPFAIWFFLAIEGVANVAEEAINPRRTMLLGFGSAILEFMNEYNYKAEVKMLGIPDRLVEHGTLKELHKECGYDAPAIAEAVREMLKNKVKVRITIAG